MSPPLRLSAGKKSALVRVCRPGRNRELDKRINDWFVHEIVSHRRRSLSWDLAVELRDQLTAEERERRHELGIVASLSLAASQLLGRFTPCRVVHLLLLSGINRFVWVLSSFSADDRVCVHAVSRGFVNFLIRDTLREQQKDATNMGNPASLRCNAVLSIFSITKRCPDIFFSRRYARANPRTRLRVIFTLRAAATFASRLRRVSAIRMAAERASKAARVEDAKFHRKPRGSGGATAREIRGGGRGVQPLGPRVCEFPKPRGLPYIKVLFGSPSLSQSAPLGPAASVVRPLLFPSRSGTLILVLFLLHSLPIRSTSNRKPFSKLAAYFA